MSRHVDEVQVGAAIEELMKNPAFNISVLPDFIEAQAKKMGAVAFLRSLEKMPAVHVFGHSVSVTVEPDVTLEEIASDWQ